MNSRMEKYEVPSNEVPKTRTSKNRRLYEEVSEIDATYIDFNDASIFNEVFEKPKSSYENVAVLENFDDLTTVEDNILDAEVKNRKEKIYDINEILRRAKEELKEEENKKRLLNTEYNILTKLDIKKIDSQTDFKKEELKELIEVAYPKKEKEDDNKELLEDLTIEDETEVNEIVNTLVEDIKEKDEVVKTKEVKVLDKKNEDTNTKKTMYDTTTKSTELLELESKNKRTLILIIVIIFILIIVGAYLTLKYFDII